MSGDVYDSDILRIETILEILNRKQRTATNLEGFRQEIIDRFARIGFLVDVRVYDTNVEGTYAWDIQIDGRTDDTPWDPDQMVHEVTNNILELPNQGGVIKTGTAEEAHARREAEKHNE